MLSTTDIGIVTGIGGLVAPLVISLLKQASWSIQIKQLVAGIVSIAIALGATFIMSPKNFSMTLAELSTFVYSGSQVVYNTYFKGSTVDTILTNTFTKKNPISVP